MTSNRIHRGLKIYGVTGDHREYDHAVLGMMPARAGRDLLSIQYKAPTVALLRQQMARLFSRQPSKGGLSDYLLAEYAVAPVPRKSFDGTEQPIVALECSLCNPLLLGLSFLSF